MNIPLPIVRFIALVSMACLIADPVAPAWAVPRRPLPAYSAPSKAQGLLFNTQALAEGLSNVPEIGKPYAHIDISASI